jgi:hypothetical protein
MAMVLSTLKALQDKPPMEEWLQFGDKPPVKKELIIQVCFTMGDKKTISSCRLQAEQHLVGRKIPPWMHVLWDQFFRSLSSMPTRANRSSA